MVRALFVLLVLFVVGRVLGLLLRSVARPTQDASRGAGRDAGPVTHMVRCAHCGTFVPAGEAVGEGDATYCSAEHRRLGPARGP